MPDLINAPGRPSLPAIDEQVLARWAADRIADRCADQACGKPAWHCLQPPWPAHGMPGAQHVRAVAITDLYRRYKRMRGFAVPASCGWDCHGLAVEVAVERQLGLAGRKDIEGYGIDRFAARCRESAAGHIEVFASFISRLGHWAAEPTAHRTMDAAHIEFAWWSLQRLFDAGLLVREHLVGPYCPRCQTPLGDHEADLPGGRRRVTDRAVTVRLRLTRPPDKISQLDGADLLVRTTQPWTLVASSGIAVHPGETYAIARKAGHDDRVVVAEAAFARLLGVGWHIATRLRGADLAGACYQPAFSLVKATGPHRVVAAGFVRATTGTGIVHLAPAFGEPDIDVAAAHGLPIINPLEPDGRFTASLPLVGGAFFRSCDQVLTQDLSDRGLLFASGRCDRRHPHCWRCGTPLITRSQQAWRLSAVRGRPGARAGWTLSRSRFWGTPLPIWECADGHLTAIGSLAELSDAAGADLSDLDPHRPQVDNVIISCPRCGRPAGRVPDVIDAWYDAGSMPLQLHRTSQAGPASRAQLAADDAGQAVAWRYALGVIGGLVFGERAFAAPLSLPAMADAQGRTMSGNAGNVVAAFDLIGRHGADAVRWMCATAAPTRDRQRAPTAETAKVAENVLLTYWNIARFLVIRGRLADCRRGSGHPGEQAAPPPARRPALDRWALSELHRLVLNVTAALEECDVPGAGHQLASFISDLSTWYVRRARRRFAGHRAITGSGQGDAEQVASAAAVATLHSCLETLTRLLAPVAPFLSDYVWNLIRTGQPADSVHLASWPVPVMSLIDERLAEQMALARRLARLGRAARRAAGIELRQPLAMALLATDGFDETDAEIRAVVAEELNVRAIDRLASGPPGGWALAADRRMAVALDPEITPDLRSAGITALVIRTVQDARRQAGLALDEAVRVRLSCADPEVASAVTEHRELISAQARVSDLGFGPPQDASAALLQRAVHGLELNLWLLPEPSGP